VIDKGATNVPSENALLRLALMRLTEINPDMTVDMKMRTPNQLMQEAIDYVAKLKLQIGEDQTTQSSANPNS
jgi:hypothetical protein